MISFPNAKINIGLSITNKRDDGFHDIESIFYPVNWCDILEVNPSKKISFKSSGIDIPGDPENNLCLKVYRSLEKEFKIPPVSIHLKKLIPIGAGLGGGSSDAAFTLKMLDELFDLKMSFTKMEKLIRPMGSDCAFFIQNQPMYAFQKGDHFKNVEINLKGNHIILVNPKIHISTADAYGGITPKASKLNYQSLTRETLFKYPDTVVNDFEKSIFPIHPTIQKIKTTLEEHGAMYTSMSGSGSTVYGIFDKKPSSTIFQEYSCFTTKL